MDRATAEDIATWRYEGSYSMYDGEADAIESFLKPEYRYFGVFDKNNDVLSSAILVRMRAFRDSTTTTLPSTSAWDATDLTGRGKGVGFVRAVLDFARRTYAPDAYRVTIANRRARQLCLALDFWEEGRFTRTDPEDSLTESVVLRR